MGGQSPPEASRERRGSRLGHIHRHHFVPGHVHEQHGRVVSAAGDRLREDGRRHRLRKTQRHVGRRVLCFRQGGSEGRAERHRQGACPRACHDLHPHGFDLRDIERGRGRHIPARGGPWERRGGAAVRVSQTRSTAQRFHRRRGGRLVARRSACAPKTKRGSSLSPSLCRSAASVALMRGPSTARTRGKKGKPRPSRARRGPVSSHLHSAASCRRLIPQNGIRDSRAGKSESAPSGLQQRDMTRSLDEMATGTRPAARTWATTCGHPRHAA